MHRLMSGLVVALLAALGADSENVFAQVKSVKPPILAPKPTPVVGPKVATPPGPAMSLGRPKSAAAKPALSPQTKAAAAKPAPAQPMAATRSASAAKAPLAKANAKVNSKAVPIDRPSIAKLPTANANAATLQGKGFQASAQPKAPPQRIALSKVQPQPFAQQKAVAQPKAQQQAFGQQKAVTQQKTQPQAFTQQRALAQQQQTRQAAAPQVQQQQGLTQQQLAKQTAVLPAQRQQAPAAQQAVALRLPPARPSISRPQQLQKRDALASAKSAGRGVDRAGLLAGATTMTPNVAALRAQNPQRAAKFDDATAKIFSPLNPPKVNAPSIPSPDGNNGPSFVPVRPTLDQPSVRNPVIDGMAQGNADFLQFLSGILPAEGFVTNFLQGALTSSPPTNAVQGLGAASGVLLQNLAGDSLQSANGAPAVTTQRTPVAPLPDDGDPDN